MDFKDLLKKARREHASLRSGEGVEIVKVSCNQVYNWLQAQNDVCHPKSLLLVDLRQKEAHLASHIRNSRSITYEEEARDAFPPPPRPPEGTQGTGTNPSSSGASTYSSVLAPVLSEGFRQTVVLIAEGNWNLPGESSDVQKAVKIIRMCPHRITRLHYLDGGFAAFSSRFPFHCLSQDDETDIRRRAPAYMGYPVEILPSRLFVGNIFQGANKRVLRRLQVKSILDLTPGGILNGGNGGEGAADDSASIASTVATGSGGGWVHRVDDPNGDDNDPLDGIGEGVEAQGEGNRGHAGTGGGELGECSAEWYLHLPVQNGNAIIDIEAALAFLDRVDSEGPSVFPTLVFDVGGHDSAAVIAASWLVHKKGVSAEIATGLVMKCKPGVRPSAVHFQQLMEFAALKEERRERERQRETASVLGQRHREQQDSPQHAAAAAAASGGTKENGHPPAAAAAAAASGGEGGESTSFSSSSSASAAAFSDPEVLSLMHTLCEKFPFPSRGVVPVGFPSAALAQQWTEAFEAVWKPPVFLGGSSDEEGPEETQVKQQRQSQVRRAVDLSGRVSASRGTDFTGGSEKSSPLPGNVVGVLSWLAELIRQWEGERAEGGLTGEKDQVQAAEAFLLYLQTRVVTLSCGGTITGPEQEQEQKREALQYAVDRARASGDASLRWLGLALLSAGGGPEKRKVLSGVVDALCEECEISRFCDLETTGAYCAAVTAFNLLAMKAQQTEGDSSSVVRDRLLPVLHSLLSRASEELEGDGFEDEDGDVGVRGLVRVVAAAFFLFYTRGQRGGNLLQGMEKRKGKGGQEWEERLKKDPDLIAALRKLCVFFFDREPSEFTTITTGDAPVCPVDGLPALTSDVLRPLGFRLNVLQSL
uniref:Rhodanese domain-containing protein n=1 Tax=Chromera velia CCMP2878 TaxID=1169474 RepID=A0A0G4H387_9ALVE|eukprot:Cvel_24457.t1-p1 / transcript=Cvel_24457.t1 / gene=Cvel_24457 / organism=Chromera_velia_CCMP2878 / gene_product=hypothetical protein / transcript_product=hypothetical protein / location=Cvel_scaffold2645:6025-13677(+) / protein_length=873 / sequence_SO=supercontig / SO=protein_coding / is_pseudo=false